MISDIKNWADGNITVTVGTEVQNLIVAQIGETKYPTLQAAFDAGGAVTLLNDITLSEAANIPSGKEVTLNLNGKTIIGPTADYAIIVDGTMSVSGETDGSAINATSNTANKGVFFVKNGQLTINSGTFTAASGVAVITIDDENDASRILVSGGTYSSDPKEFCIDGYASVALNDGKYYVGEVTISGDPTVSETNSDNTQATYTVTAVITDDNNTQHSVTTGQSIVVSTDVTGDAGEDVKLGDIKVNDVLTKAIAAVSNSGNDATKVTQVEIGIEANVTVAANTTEKTKAFDVKPVANIKVTSASDTKIQLGNEDMTDNATFKFSLDLSDLSLAEGTLVQIVHTSDDPTIYPAETLYASVASGKVNVTTKHFSTFSVSVPASGTALESFVLTDDGDDYSATHETYPYPSGQNVTGVITYKRAFAAARIGKYQSWFVPFDYVIKEADAAKFNFYKINMVANSAVEGNAETVDANQIWIHLKQMSKDETLYGNMPYVIQPIDGQYTADEVYEFKTSEGTSLKAMNTDAVLSTQTSVATYNFYGTYQNTVSTKNHDFLYVNSQGQICWSVYPWSYSIAPYRWIIKMESKGISYAPMLNFVEDDTTGISEKSVANGAYDTSAQYFNMNGQHVQQPTKGLYIVNGKKVIVK